MSTAVDAWNNAADASRLRELERDAMRLDWLESKANEPGGILLHDGSEQGRAGLGLRPGTLRRTLREAIDCGLFGEAKPELLQGCKEVVRALQALTTKQQRGFYDIGLQHALEAIAKATGERYVP